MRLLPRVGDRPAGAVRGDDLATLVLSLAAGDLGFRIDRGRGEEALTGLVTEASASLLGNAVGVEEALVRTKWEGLKRSLVRLSDPLDLLEKKMGSTFSESSRPATSEALRLEEGGVEIAMTFCLARSSLQLRMTTSQGKVV